MENYAGLVKEIKVTSRHSVNEGLLGTGKISHKNGGCRQIDAFAVINPVPVHKSLVPVLPAPLDIKLSIGKQSRQFTLYKNALLFGQYEFYEPSVHSIFNADACLEKARQERSLRAGKFDTRYKQYGGINSKVRRDLLHTASSDLLVYRQDNNTAYVGTRYILKIPVKVKDENGLKLLAQELGLKMLKNTGGFKQESGFRTNIYK